MFGPPRTPKMHPFAAEAARAALGKIFWGVLLCALDFSFSSTVNGSGVRFDVLNDAAGMALIVWGLSQLAPLWDEPSYRQTLSLCWYVAMLALGQAILDHFIVRWPPPVAVLSILLHLASLYATFRFCDAMRLFCWLGQYLEAEQSWRLSRTLFFFLNVIPAVILHGIGLLQIAAGTHDTVILEPLAIAILIAALVPLVHILISIARTRSELLNDISPIPPK